MNVCVTIPTFNGSAWLEPSLRALCGDVLKHAPWPMSVCIAENGSTDESAVIADRLARHLPNVSTLHFDQPGRGRALRSGWLESDSDVLCYMDVDLSTDPSHLFEMIEAVAAGRWDLAVGSRLLRSSDTTRGWRRNLTSRGYNFLVRSAFGVGFTDAQCGFKAISRRAARALLPMVEDPHWFFDTELLVIAERAGCRIYDFPVRWRENQQSTVRLVPTVLHMLRGILRLQRRIRNGLAVEARRRWKEASVGDWNGTLTPAANLRCP